ncbi:cytochrome o ubiquinol oxidase subunit I [Candidatus Aerophobetes bacterium]|uniref:Cytochrome o ubiquinol oxidase subunit I n=1 Tax=Aerophobetes bacterium TaxID=2030807 RepID=A0A2A4X5N8_UNCAE|nr:MAG: cytochrome o ubiquinol oxidase subunit I [Candidatus Aerophobetes bacterium]
MSFWLFVAGALYILLSLVVGKFAGTGWTAYPPLSGIKYNPGEGVDYWAWSIQISGIGSMLSGINFLVTILKMRCKGMTLWRMPIFVWAVLATVVLIIFAFPILTATIAMLSTDRLLYTKIFTAGFGGSPMMYINLIWAWGHPEVYILVLPMFGVFSEVVPVFSHKRLFGYSSMVWALMGITVLSFVVWLHHFFTMGAGGSVNGFFGIMTALIAIPTGVKVFNWLFTMYRGRVEFATPMLWFMGFIVLFVSGGMTGVMMSIPAIDFQVHNSLFLIAHFHSVIIGAVLFGFFSAYSYWFPKFTGFKLNEKLGKYAFWCWIIGFIVAFMPLYLLGFMGATRRLNHYAASTGWQPLFIVASIGAIIILCGVGFQLLQLYVSIKNRNKEKRGAKDPWNGRTLEWSISSPPPFYNFAHEPEVHEKDAWWELKHNKDQKVKPYESIHMPTNSSLPVFIGIISFIGGFALVWHMFWLAGVSVLGILVCLIIRLSDRHTEFTVEAKEIEKIEREAVQ